jgi:outer membrane PBP1 activator LpoA protein
MINLKRLAIITLFAILATACGTHQPNKNGSSSQVPKSAAQDIKNFLAQAATASPDKAAQLKLQAAKLMLLQQRFSDVANLLSNVNYTGLNTEQQFDFVLTKAKAAIGLNDGQSAISLLATINTDDDISTALLKDKYATSANAYGLTNQLANEAVARVNESRYTTDNNELLDTNETIWQLLSTLDLSQLNQIKAQKDDSYTLRGWLALFIAFKETPNSEKVVANEWQNRWGSHSAARFQPTALAAYLSREPLINTQYNYQHVVVALPKSGKYAKGAATIMTGIKLAAKNTNNNLQVSYIDSAIHNSATAILAQAQLLNADAIIGPLDRDIVSQFAQMPALPLPILALNSTVIGNSNLYQFSLSNDDEVRDAAHRAYKDGKRSMLALVPKGEQGQLAANIFTDTFSSLGGRVLTTAIYDTNEGNVTSAIAGMLQLNQARIRGLQRKVKTAHLRSAIRRMTRKDADGIFLFANKRDAYQIGPSLLYFYADNLPLYSTSKIHSGKVNPTKDIDLNGMMFGDLPWVLLPSSNKNTLARSVRNTDTRLGRLYAFGIDAFNLAPKLYTLATQPQSTLSGETGVLSISADNMVEKTLSWAKFSDGELVNLPNN